MQTHPRNPSHGPALLRIGAELVANLQHYKPKPKPQGSAKPGSPQPPVGW